MLKLACKVEITRQWTKKEGLEAISIWSIERVNEIEITGDSETLADTCRIVLAKNSKWQGYEAVPIRRGDQVKVWLGYGEKKKVRFMGYVKEVAAKTPMVLTCEDEMFKLRGKSAPKKAYRKGSLKEILTDIVPKSVAWLLSGDVTIGAYRITADTVAGVLMDLKENYGVRSFFALKDEVPTLYVYTVFPEQRRSAGEYSEKKNIIEDDLEYRRSTDTAVRVRGISIGEDNSRIEWVEGDSSGVERTIYRYSCTLAELKVAVANEIKRLQWDGLAGTFTTFGSPVVEKMDTVDLKKEGITKARYQVKGVNISFGMGGYRQKIELEKKIMDL
jgi:Phage late control gene D protein (GPD).